VTQVEERHDDGGEVELYDLLDAAEVVEVEDEPQPRKPVYATVTGYSQDELRPIVPAWLRSKDDRRAFLRYHGRRKAHVAAYHGSRTLTGWYPLLATGYAFRGMGRAAKEFQGWAFDKEYKPLRAEARRKLDSNDAIKHRNLRDRRVKWRARVFWSVLTLAFGGAAAAYFLLTPLQLTVLVIALFISFAPVGKPKGRAAFGHAVVSAPYTKLTESMVVEALVDAKLAQFDKDGKTRLVWVQPPQRDGAGYLAVIDLPPGVTFQDAADARAKIASGLGCTTDQVWTEKDKASERRLRLWVADQPMSQVEMPLWPLLKTGRVDIFGEFPFGLNARGRTASMTLMYSNLLIGAIPGQGKSFAARLAALACALDPTVELHVFDLKGGADWLAFEAIAHVCRIGDQPEDVEFVILQLREVRREMQRRYGLLQQLARAKDPRAPEGKVTRELASDPSMRMQPILVAIDEVQVLFQKACVYRDEAEALLTDLVKRGRAVGVIGVLATQKPDAESLPSGIRDNVNTRFALKVMTPQASDMVLGGGMSKAGYRAHAFTADDLGVGFLRGRRPDSSTADAEVVKAFYVDQPGAELVAARARVLREGAGTITGQAAGVTPTHRTSLIEDVLMLMDGDRQHCGDIAAALAANYPDQYAGWDAERLGGALRGQGVEVRQIKIRTVNRMGVERNRLVEAFESRFSL
jgi:S-DNA-T family DNA segregation ATPase FtsK/SpoIIIE